MFERVNSNIEEDAQSRAAEDWTVAIGPMFFGTGPDQTYKQDRTRSDHVKRKKEEEGSE
ncbi:hypothetical protein LguiB_024929 [Lonicera macranthoides]